MGKISDAEFWPILRENGGLFSRTVRAIKDQYGVDITRQAVKQRAMKDPEQLADIREQNIDIAEEGLYSLMRSKNERIRLDSCRLFLTTIGRNRGYVTREEIVDVSEKPTKYVIIQAKEGDGETNQD